MKHIKLFENWVNEEFANDLDKKKVIDWVNSVENFVNIVRDEELAGNITGFPDKESTMPLARLVYGEYYDLMRPAEINPLVNDSAECLSWYMSVHNPKMESSIDESPENMYGTNVSPEVEDRMMKLYKEMVNTRNSLGSTSLKKLNELMNLDDETVDFLQNYEDGRFIWDTKDPSFFSEEDCTPSKLRTFVENSL